MERELEKDLKEIEYLIYVHKERENTHTQSVLERAHEIIETCAKAARTLSELEELLSRENDTEITRSSRDNDGWMSVEKDLPKNGSEVWVVLESTYGTGYRTYSSARYLYFENYGEGHWCDEHYGYLEWDKYSDGRGGSSQYKVIAWRSIAPYHPERSEEE